MKTVIVYVSTHHGNTKRLVDAISAQCKIQTINAAETKEADLSDFDTIGIASGVAFGKYYPQMLAFLERNLPENKTVFFMHTAGSPRESHAESAQAIANAKHCRTAGTFCCKGFDTFGPFKLLGGINKSRPNETDIAKAVDFFKSLTA